LSEREILPGLIGRKPSKIKTGQELEESFLGEALSERNRDRLQNTFYEAMAGKKGSVKERVHL